LRVRQESTQAKHLRGDPLKPQTLDKAG
jgi:hypothetical protein